MHGYDKHETIALRGQGNRGGNAPALTTCRVIWAGKHLGQQTHLTARRITESRFHEEHHGKRRFRTIRNALYSQLDHSDRSDGGEIFFDVNRLQDWLDECALRRLRAKQAENLFSVLVRRPECPDHISRVNIEAILRRLNKSGSSHIEKVIKGMARFNETGVMIEIPEDDHSLNKDLSSLMNCSSRNLVAAAVEVFGASSSDLLALNPDAAHEKNAVVDNGYRGTERTQSTKTTTVGPVWRKQKETEEEKINLPATIEALEVISKDEQATQESIPKESGRIIRFPRFGRRPLTMVVIVFLLAGIGASASLATFKIDLKSIWKDHGVSGALANLTNWWPESIPDRITASYMLIRDRQYEKASKELFGIISDSDNHFQNARAHFLLGNIQMYQANFNSALGFLSESEKNYRKSIDTSKPRRANEKWLAKQLIKIEKERARAYIRLVNFEKAKESIDLARHYSEISNEEFTLASMEWEYYFRRGDLQEALRVANQMHENSADTRIDKLMYESMSLISIGETEKGIAKNQLAMLKAFKQNNEQAIMYAYCNMIFANRAMGIDSGELISVVRDFAKQDNEVHERLELAINHLPEMN